MDERIKQRLVGALVIVALGVIFVPMILEGPHDLGEPGSQIPVPPTFDGQAVNEPLVLPPPTPAMPPQAVLSAPMPDQPVQRTVEAPASEDDAEQPPAPAPKVEKTAPVDPALQGFVVQVASLSNEGNAFALRDRLREQGFTSFVERAETEKGVLFRVRIGPEIKRENADKLRSKLEKTTEFKGLVQSYP